MPTSLDKNRLLKLSRPVSIANMEDSTFSGISLANSTIAGSVVYALYRVSVTVEVKHRNATGGSPKKCPVVYKTVVAAPIMLMIKAVYIMFLVSQFFSRPL